MENLTFSLQLPNMGADIRFDHFNIPKIIEPSSFAFHSHAVYEAYLIKSGQIEVCVGEETLTLRKHDILMISPHTLHRVKECSEDLQRFNLRFLLNTETSVVPPAPYYLYEPTAENKKELFDIIDKIYRHIPLIDQSWEFFRIRGYFGILLSYLVESLLPAQNQEERKVYRRSARKSKIDLQIQIELFFSENYSRPITIAHLAGELHYSKTHVNRLLQSDFGLSFSDKLDQTRLQAAKQYLRESQEPIHQIAERCGYSTLRGFELFFKKYTGMLPKEYRKGSE